MVRKKSYKNKALDLFIKKLGKPVTSEELARLTGSSGSPISHNIRRIFELRDEDGYEIVNYRDNERTGLNLKNNQWVLLSDKPNESKIKSRGVNKRIRIEVFKRDDFTCQFCGRTPEDNDPTDLSKKIKLHIGHKEAHKSKNHTNKKEKILGVDDFITMCSVCNEGLKNDDIKKITIEDRVEKSTEKEKLKIYKSLKKYFKD